MKLTQPQLETICDGTATDTVINLTTKNHPEDVGTVKVEVYDRDVENIIETYYVDSDGTEVENY